MKRSTDQVLNEMREFLCADSEISAVEALTSMETMLGHAILELVNGAELTLLESVGKDSAERFLLAMSGMVHVALGKLEKTSKNGDLDKLIAIMREKK